MKIRMNMSVAWIEPVLRHGKNLAIPLLLQLLIHSSAVVELRSSYSENEYSEVINIHHYLINILVYYFAITVSVNIISGHSIIDAYSHSLILYFLIFIKGKLSCLFLIHACITFSSTTSMLNLL